MVSDMYSCSVVWDDQPPLSLSQAKYSNSKFPLPVLSEMRCLSHQKTEQVSLACHTYFFLDLEHLCDS